MKRLESAKHDIAELEVIECDCGFHIGLDATYMDQVEDFKINCPSCGTIIDTAIICPEDEERTTEQQRRDEKNGLYSEFVDDTN